MEAKREAAEKIATDAKTNAAKLTDAEKRIAELEAAVAKANADLTAKATLQAAGSAANDDDALSLLQEAIDRLDQAEAREAEARQQAEAAAADAAGERERAARHEAALAAEQDTRREVEARLAKAEEDAADTRQILADLRRRDSSAAEATAASASATAATKPTPVAAPIVSEAEASEPVAVTVTEVAPPAATANELAARSDTSNKVPIIVAPLAASTARDTGNEDSSSATSISTAAITATALRASAAGAASGVPALARLAALRQNSAGRDDAATATPDGALDAKKPRRDQRTVSRMPVTLWKDGLPQAISCTLVDKSSSGAQVELSGAKFGARSTEVEIGDRYTLTFNFARECTTVMCRVMWIESNRAGLQYCGPFKTQPIRAKAKPQSKTSRI